MNTLEDAFINIGMDESKYLQVEKNETDAAASTVIISFLIIHFFFRIDLKTITDWS